MALHRDQNFGPTDTRRGDPIGGILDQDSTSLTADEWYRLFPSGTASKVSDTPNQLDIGTLRSDISNIKLNTWNLKILNQGYQQILRIANEQSEVLTFTSDIEYWETLSSTVQWVLYPNINFPLTIIRDKASAGGILEIGFADKNSDEEDPYSSPDISSLYRISDEDFSHGIKIRTTQLHRLFYKFVTLGTNASDKEILIWGELDIVS